MEILSGKKVNDYSFWRALLNTINGLSQEDLLRLMKKT